MKFLFNIVTSVCFLLCISCEKDIHPLNDLFKNSNNACFLYDFRKRPVDLEQVLIEQIPLSTCDDFGTCDLNMSFTINHTDTVCLPVYLDGLFKTEHTFPFCGYRNISELLINQNNQLLYELEPIEVNILKSKWLNRVRLANEESDKVLYLSIKWHPFTSFESTEKVFAVLIDVVTTYYEQESQRLFQKPISRLTLQEKKRLIEDVTQIKYYQPFNQIIALPVQLVLINSNMYEY